MVRGAQGTRNKSSTGSCTSLLSDSGEKGGEEVEGRRGNEAEVHNGGPTLPLYSLALDAGTR